MTITLKKITCPNCNKEDTYQLTDGLGALKCSFCDRLFKIKQYTFVTTSKWDEQPSDLPEQPIFIDGCGLDEALYYAFCSNHMRSDSGCDGNCIVDTLIHEKIMKLINGRKIK